MVYGYATLGNLDEFVTKVEKNALDAYNKALEDAKEVRTELEELAKILPEGTIFWVYGKEIQLQKYTSAYTTIAEEEYPDEEEFKELLVAGIGNLKKTQTHDGRSVDYSVKTPKGYKVQIKAVPPNCEVEEYEEIIPEQRVKKYRIKCDDGTVTDLAGNPIEGTVEG